MLWTLTRIDDARMRIRRVTRLCLMVCPLLPISLSATAGWLDWCHGLNRNRYDAAVQFRSDGAIIYKDPDRPDLSPLIVNQVWSDGPELLGFARKHPSIVRYTHILAHFSDFNWQEVPLQAGKDGVFLKGHGVNLLGPQVQIFLTRNDSAVSVTFQVVHKNPEQAEAMRALIKEHSDGIKKIDPSFRVALESKRGVSRTTGEQFEVTALDLLGVFKPSLNDEFFSRLVTSLLSHPLWD